MDPADNSMVKGFAEGSERATLDQNVHHREAQGTGEEVWPRRLPVVMEVNRVAQPSVLGTDFNLVNPSLNLRDVLSPTFSVLFIITLEGVFVPHPKCYTNFTFRLYVVPCVY